MNTSAIGGRLAMERPASKGPAHTRAYGGSDRVTDFTATPTRGWVNPSGAILKEEIKYYQNDATRRGGMEWTGRGRALRIPTTWKDAYLRLVKRIGDWMNQPVSKPPC